MNLLTGPEIGWGREAAGHKSSHAGSAQLVLLHQGCNAAHGWRSLSLPTLKFLWVCHSCSISFRNIYCTYCNSSHCLLKLASLVFVYFFFISFLSLTCFFFLNLTQGPSESTMLSHSYVSLYFLYWPLPNEPWEQKFSWLTPFALGQMTTVCAAVSCLESTETCLPVLVGKLTENTATELFNR